jgi:hypothetical protein
VCQQAIREVARNHPKRAIEFECFGEANGEWDPDYVLVLARDLLLSSLRSSGPAASVVASVIDSKDDVMLVVASRTRIEGAPRPTSSAGGVDCFAQQLSEEIVRAHRGWIATTADDEVTMAVVDLPKRAPTEDGHALLEQSRPTASTSAIAAHLH